MELLVTPPSSKNSLKYPSYKIETRGDFPGSPVVKNPPCNAGDTDSIPGGGTKIPHAAEQLSPQLLSLCVLELVHHKERSHVLKLRPNAAKKKGKKLDKNMAVKWRTTLNIR